MGLPRNVFFLAAAVTAATPGLACSPKSAPTPNHEDDEELHAVSQSEVVDRSVLPAPAISLTPDEAAKFAPLPASPPVLAFHQICPDTCAASEKYGMSRAEFERTMLMLKAAGYASITPAQYLRYLRSDWVGLPQKPILLTFDDGRLDAYQGVDAILQATGMRATMFIITDRPDANLGFMTWAEVAGAQASGRWDIQLHAHAGHTLMPVTIDGSVVSKPFYAYKKDGETYAQWKVRAESDVLTGIARLRAKVPGYQPLLFAAPYGEYGQLGSNDPAIEASLSTFLTAQFGAWFGAPPLDFTLLGSTKNKQRYTVINTTTAMSTYAWLKNQTLRRAKSPVSATGICAANQSVTNHVCVPCAPGSTRPAGDPAIGNNTSCAVAACAANQFVSNHGCVTCPAGTARAAGDLATGPDTSCSATCAANQFVSSHACVACPVGTARAAGDVIGGSDTSCSPIVCDADQSVTDHACVACAPGSTRPAGDLATGSNTSCTPRVCAANQSVSNHTCVACAPEGTRPAGGLASGADTSCTATYCAGNQAVTNHACVTCAPGTDRWAGDPIHGSDTTCTPTGNATAFDVVIVGAGTGGIGAALQAARLGRTVALLEETNTIGGQMAAAAVTTMDSGRTGVDSGIYKEAVDRMTQLYKANGKKVGTCGWSAKNLCFEPVVAREVFRSMLIEQPKITLLKRTKVTDVRRTGNTVTGVAVEQVGGPRRDLSASIVIDATEWGDVLPLANIPYRVGNVQGPSVDATKCVQHNTYTSVVRKYPAGVPAELVLPGPPSGYTSAIRNELAKTLSPLKDCPAAAPGVTPPCYDWTQGGAKQYPVNWRTYVGYRGLPDSQNPSSYDVSQPDKITLTGTNWANDLHFSVVDIESPVSRRTHVCDAKLKTLQLLYFIQKEVDPTWSVATDQQFDTEYDPASECPAIGPEFRAITRYFPPIPYVRESRRAIGVETLTASDMYRTGTPAVARRRFKNALAVGDYMVDIHGCRTNADLEAPESGADIPPGGLYGPFQVPMGVFIPATVDGFLVAEKNLSVTRLANGAIRLQPITMMTGQAVGALAALSITHGTAPRDFPAILVQDVLSKAGLRLAQEGMADVTAPSGWAAAQLVATREVMPGFSDGTFRPASLLSRADAAVILAKAFELPSSSPSLTLGDVAPSHPAAAEIAAVLAAGLVPGCAEGAFCPDLPFTRRDVAASVARGMAWDAQADSLQLALSHGILAPCAQGGLCPDDTTTRGAMAIAIARVLVLRTPGFGVAMLTPPHTSTDATPAAVAEPPSAAPPPPATPLPTVEEGSTAETDASSPGVGCRTASTPSSEAPFAFLAGVGLVGAAVRRLRKRPSRSV